MNLMSLSLSLSRARVGFVVFDSAEREWFTETLSFSRIHYIYLTLK